MEQLSKMNRIIFNYKRRLHIIELDLNLVIFNSGRSYNITRNGRGPKGIPLT
jgi:hypothetical protein